MHDSPVASESPSVSVLHARRRIARWQTLRAFGTPLARAAGANLLDVGEQFRIYLPQDTLHGFDPGDVRREELVGAVIDNSSNMRHAIDNDFRDPDAVSASFGAESQEGQQSDFS